MWSKKPRAKSAGLFLSSRRETGDELAAVGDEEAAFVVGGAFIKGRHDVSFRTYWLVLAAILGRWRAALKRAIAAPDGETLRVVDLAIVALYRVVRTLQLWIALYWRVARRFGLFCAKERLLTGLDDEAGFIGLLALLGVD